MSDLCQPWDPQLYQGSHSFVWQYGEALLDLLNPQPGEQIVDLGCGLGQLTAAIAETGAFAEGIDADAAMIEQAHQSYPGLSFRVADARSFQVETPVDAVFSNAALHWIARADQPQVAQQIYNALKLGGRLVFEMGGQGCVQTILDALHIIRAQLGCGTPAATPWYFPSLGEQASLLERCGFEVSLGLLFDRPTPLAGDKGLANWIFMFAGRYLSDLPAPQQMVVIEEVENWLRSSMYQDGRWMADYRRLRMVAIKRGIV